jgi:hypothetical protein
LVAANCVACKTRKNNKQTQTQTQTPTVLVQMMSISVLTNDENFFSLFFSFSFFLSCSPVSGSYALGGRVQHGGAILGVAVVLLVNKAAKTQTPFTSSQDLVCLFSKPKPK